MGALAGGRALKRRPSCLKIYTAAGAAALTCLVFWLRLSPGLSSNGTRVCPVKHLNITLADVKAGQVPHLYRNSDGQYSCPGGCPEAVQAAQLRAWLERGYTLPLTLTPCQLWRHLEGRTLWLMGDSMVQDFYLAIRCFMREFWDSTEDEPLTGDAEILAQVAFLPDWAPARCVRLAGGSARLCFFRIDHGANCTHGALPFLRDAGVASPSDLVVANMGLHHGEAAQLDSLTREFAAYVAQHRAALPRVLWQQTAAQHFKTASGDWPGGTQPPYECAPLADGALDVRGDGEVVVKAGRGDPRGLGRGNWHNLLADPHMRAAGIPVIESWNETVAMWEAHRSNGEGHECTHYCRPSAMQSWIVALYRTLQQDR